MLACFGGGDSADDIARDRMENGSRSVSGEVRQDLLAVGLILARGRCAPRRHVAEEAGQEALAAPLREPRQGLHVGRVQLLRRRMHRELDRVGGILLTAASRNGDRIGAGVFGIVEGLLRGGHELGRLVLRAPARSRDLDGFRRLPRL